MSQYLSPNILVFLRKTSGYQKRFDVKILSFAQALEYFDLYSKKRDLYYESLYPRQVDGKTFHYWFLSKDLVPKFAEAWNKKAARSSDTQVVAG